MQQVTAAAGLTTQGTASRIPVRLSTLLIMASLAAAAYVLAPVIAAGIAPMAWIAEIWQGDAGLPLHQQVPGFERLDLRMPALVLGALPISLLLHGITTGRQHTAKRLAMISTGISIYLVVLSSPLPYTAARALLSAIAFGLILAARLMPRFRPVKTVLFFIGVGFTCEALAWSLADRSATLIGFAMFSAVAAFFTIIDRKRAVKTAVFCSAGLAVLVVAVNQVLHTQLFTLTTGLLGWLVVSSALITFGRRRHSSLQPTRRRVDAARAVHALSQPFESSMPENPQQFDTTPTGLSQLMYPHIELLGRRGSRIVYHAPELRVSEDPNSGLTMFDIAAVFGDTSSVLIGCGTPNLATSVYDSEAGSWKRLSAFMLYREPSSLTELPRLQAGVYFELRGLGVEARRRLLAAMQAHTGLRAISCARLNARVLTSAGFSLGNGRSMTRVVRPSRLSALIWQHGLTYEGAPVDIRVVNTSPLEVGDHFAGVWRKEANSPVRLVAKIVRRKLKSTADLDREAQVAAIRGEDAWKGAPITIWMNRPNLLGMLLMLIWGRHPEFKVSVPHMRPVPGLTQPLQSFPGQLSWMSKAKKHFLFSRSVVAMINRIKNKSFDRFDDVPIDAALEMLSPVAKDRDRVMWNFALILTGDNYEIRLSPLKNLDPKSQASRLRRTSNWILAKHVVATGYDPRTVYAGEAWVERGDDSLTLCMNNNSGTYKPTVTQLATVGELVAKLGIDVRTVPHVTPA